MKKKVLVYDNQIGYYNLLNDTVKNGYDFQLFSNSNNQYDGYDAVVFFLHDEIEFLDMVKLYNPKTPFVLGASKRNDKLLESQENMYSVDLGQTREGIEKKLLQLLQTLQ